MASLDTSRPAAMEQLKILGNENQIDVLDIIPNQKPLILQYELISKPN